MALDFNYTWVMNIQILRISPKIISVTMIIVIFAKKKAIRLNYISFDYR